MRYSLLITCLLLATACGTKSSHPEAEQAIVKYGVIAAKQDVSANQVESGTRGNTSVYGSISSGGRVSIGIGIGVLLSSIGGGSEPQAVRYDVNLKDGGQITVYHESRYFEVDDCVRITVYPDEQEHAPDMERDKDGCG